MDYSKDYLSYLKPLVKEKRYIHTLGVIDEAICYAKRYDVDVNKARIAASLHDICKYFEIEKSKELILRYMSLDEYNMLPLGAIHSYAAYSYCKDELKIDDEEILNAIKYHTIGRINMTTLEKIIYLADFSDPSRNMPYCKEIHDRTLKDIDESLYESMKIVYNDISTRTENKPSILSLEKTLEVLNYYKDIVMNKELELIKDALEDAKLENISLYDMENTNPFFNYIFIATASNTRQLGSVIYKFDEKNIKYEHIEGRDSKDWILIDSIDVLVNIMSKDARELYNLDNLYSNFKKLI